VAAGHVWLKLTTHGKSAHPGGDQPWINAAYKLAHILVAIEDPDKWMTYQRHPLLTSLGGKPRVHVGVLRAGESVNSIPDVAEARIDIRLNPGQTIEGVLGELNALLAKLKAEDRELDVTIERLPGTQHVPSHYWAAITPDEPLIKIIRQVARERLGHEPGFVGNRAGGRPDIWRLGSTWISWSANTVGNMHAPDEWTDLNNLQKSAEAYVEIFLRVLQ
jgi:acetylornithine deacetylase/succinyl-diaminopimelate desuccinylase-like protein